MTTSWKGLAAASVALGLTLLPDIASAQPWPTYRGDGRYEDSYINRQPRRGYTGWGSGPLRHDFCDYIRYPIRRCNNGRCRTVAWETRQSCY
jgi:hypothetical protein